jgi:Ca2+-transporting ATPase
MPNKMAFYMKTVKEVFEALKTGDKGLSSEEVDKRLAEYGENSLTTRVKTPKWLKFLFQFKDVLVIILIVAGTTSYVIGNFRDGTIMFIIVLINAVVGYLQEYKAEKIMDSLQKLVQSPAKVFRNGAVMELSQDKLVPGDLIQLDEGDKVPADCRIIESFNLRTNDFSLTGESMPQEKHSNTIKKTSTLADRDNMAYLGTTVAAGNAKGIIVATGMHTELGKIASLTQEEEKSQTPLQVELGTLGNRITIFAILIGIMLFGVTIWQGLGWNLALIYALGIAVAVVPQALPMQITVALSNGGARLAREHAVVKQLSSVETLGSTNVISTDKTGTLTKNEMTVRNLWFDGQQYEITGVGYEPKGNIVHANGKELTEEEIDKIEIMFDTATMASNAEIHEPDDNHSSWYPIGDPTEAALITASTKLGTRSPREDEENPELQEFSFDSVRKRMSSVRKFDDRVVLCMKGALGSILSISKHIYKNGKAEVITEQDSEAIQKASVAYAQKAMRVLAFGYRELQENTQDYSMEDVEKNIIFLGLMAMSDPPKEGVKEAIEKAHEAHIKTYIMTGDHALTAQAVGKQISLSRTDKEVMVITGEELAETPDEKLQTIMKGNESLIFSRVSPEDKLRIVKTLKSQGAVVAVTGDGVNDAPALKSAHIGVAMGSIGTDVAKEASELILLDDSFSTLVYAIREGRTIYHNLKKTIIASLTSNGAELSIVLLGLVGVGFFGWPIPILAIQILAIDLLAEILPLTALTFDPGSQDIMISPPRSQEEHILNRNTMIEIAFLGFLMGALGFINFGVFLQRTGVELDMAHVLYPRATTLSYATIVCCQYVNILSRRYSYDSIFNSNFWSNKKILWSLIISIVLTLVAIYIPVINHFLGFAPLTLKDWVTILASALVFLSAHEIIKMVKRSKIKTTAPSSL